MTEFKIYKSGSNVIAENIANSNDKITDSNITNLFNNLVNRWNSEANTVTKRAKILAGDYASDIVIRNIFGTSTKYITIEGEQNASGQNLTRLYYNGGAQVFRFGVCNEAECQTSLSQGYINLRNLKFDGLDRNQLRQGIAINASKYLNFQNLDISNFSWKGIRISVSNPNQADSTNLNINNIRFYSANMVVAGLYNSNISNLYFHGKPGIPGGTDVFTQRGLTSFLLVSILEREAKAMVQNCKFDNIVFDSDIQIPYVDSTGSQIYWHGGIVGFQWTKDCLFNNIKYDNTKTVYDPGYGPMQHLVQFEPVLGTNYCSTNPCPPEVRENIKFTNCYSNNTSNSSIIFRISKCNLSKPVTFSNSTFKNSGYKNWMRSNEKALIYMKDTENVVFDNNTFTDGLASGIKDIDSSNINIIFRCNIPNSVNNRTCCEPPGMNFVGN